MANNESEGDHSDPKPEDPPVRKKPDVDSALDLLEPYNTDNLKFLLRNARPRLPAVGDKKALLERIREAVRQRQISLADIVDRLDEIEGWGNQQVYLVRAPDALTDQWSNEPTARLIVEAAGLGAAFNTKTRALLPQKRTLVEIAWSPQRVRFVWVETRRWLKLKSEHDKGDYIQKNFLKRWSRGVIAFDWNLLNGRAMIMIQELPSGSNFRLVRDGVVADLKPMMNVSLFSQVALAGAIKKIDKSGEVDRRSISSRTRRKSGISISSGNRKSDIDDDPEAAAMHKMTKDMKGHLGNFYWKAGEKAPLRYRLHTMVYAADDRVGIHAERTQEEVEYVLGRIWHHLGG